LNFELWAAAVLRHRGYVIPRTVVASMHVIRAAGGGAASACSQQQWTVRTLINNQHPHITLWLFVVLTLSNTYVVSYECLSGYDVGLHAASSRTLYNSCTLRLITQPLRRWLRPRSDMRNNKEKCCSRNQLLLLCSGMSERCRTDTLPIFHLWFASRGFDSAAPGEMTCCLPGHAIEIRN
jgi:hypothetical protein